MTESKEQKKNRKSVSFKGTFGESQDDKVEAIIPNVPAVRQKAFVLPVHLPVLIIALFKNGLTEDPLRSMFRSLPILVILQIVLGFLITTATSGTSRNKESDRAIIVLFSTFLSIIMSNAFFILIVLFGAPVLSHLKETYLLSYHLALISIQPVLILYRLDYELIFATLQAPNVVSLVIGNPILASCLSTLIGGWLGVLPIPLDWDRPWQQWPLTILTGAYVGGFFGLVISCVWTSFLKRKHD